MKRITKKQLAEIKSLYKKHVAPVVVTRRDLQSHTPCVLWSETIEEVFKGQAKLKVGTAFKKVLPERWFNKDAIRDALVFLFDEGFLADELETETTVPCLCGCGTRVHLAEVVGYLTRPQIKELLS